MRILSNLGMGCREFQRQSWAKLFAGGSEAIEITSKIYSLLVVGGGASTPEQIFYSIANYN
jgi:hypothetical protein